MLLPWLKWISRQAFSRFQDIGCVNTARSLTTVGFPLNAQFYRPFRTMGRGIVYVNHPRACSVPSTILFLLTDRMPGLSPTIAWWSGAYSQSIITKKKNMPDSIYSLWRQSLVSWLQTYEPFGGEISVFPSISSIGSSLPLTIIYGGNVSVSTML